MTATAAVQETGNQGAPPMQARPPKTKKSSSAPKRGNGESAARAQVPQGPMGRQKEQYEVRATEVKRRMRIGNGFLASILSRRWLEIHHASVYVQVYGPDRIGGKVPKRAIDGLQQYVAEVLEEAQALVKAAREEADGNGIDVGASSMTTEYVAAVSTAVETDILSLVQALDDYLVITDSLWISKVLEIQERDAALIKVKNTMQRLLSLEMKLRNKLVAYRKALRQGKVNDQDVIDEIEELVDTTPRINNQPRKAREPKAAAQKTKQANSQPPQKPAAKEEKNDGAGEKRVDAPEAVPA